MSTWPLVGRSAELATVRGLVDAAAAGSGGAVMAAGEAGIGKSRLLPEAFGPLGGGRLRWRAGRSAADAAEWSAGI